jgi:UDP-3-O-[3-hydroxymyristoyl] glucosamine N-acyltransferase
LIGRDTLIVPGVVLGGSTIIGDRCFIGINATTRERISIGDDCTLGMGAVLLKSIGDGETWYGNPARKR